MGFGVNVDGVSMCIVDLEIVLQVEKDVNVQLNECLNVFYEW